MSGTSNPFQAFVERRLLRAFLRSGSTTIYEETLGVSSDASPDSIRAAYKAASLRLHPDKIRQLHGRDPTEEEKKSLLVAKDAYQVLSDSVRRQKYKDLGHVGMKMSEGVFEDGVQVSSFVSFIIFYAITSVLLNAEKKRVLTISLSFVF